MKHQHHLYFRMICAIVLLAICCLTGCVATQPVGTAKGQPTAAVTRHQSRAPQTERTEKPVDPQAAASVREFLSGKPEAGKWYCPSPDRDFTGIYVGAFSGYDIVLEQTTMCMVTVRQIGNERFRYGSSFILWAVRDGAVRYLEDVYADGSLTDGQLGEISLAYAQTESQRNHPTVGAGDAAALSADERALLNDALRAKCGTDAFGQDGNPTAQVRYYGKFDSNPGLFPADDNTYYVFFAQGQMAVTVCTYLDVAGSFFYHPEAFSILLVTGSGNVMTVREAYEAGYLLREDVATLARIHKAVEIEVGHYEEKGWTYPDCSQTLISRT